MNDNTPASANPTAPAPAGGLRQFVMPGLVLGFLGAHMLFIFIAISLAVGDPTFAVVPDYYQKGVAWDEHKQQLADSAEMGWSVLVEPDRAVTVRGERELAVTLHDAAGQPITDANVIAEMYHHARASQVVTAQLTPGDEPGRYTAVAEMRREGVWDITIDVTRGEEAFLYHEKMYVRGSNDGGGR